MGAVKGAGWAQAHYATRVKEAICKLWETEQKR